MAIAADKANLVHELLPVRSEFKITEISSIAKRRQFPGGTSSFEVTQGGCSCDIYSAPVASPDNEAQRVRARLVKRGWSHAKVERAVLESTTAGSRKSSLTSNNAARGAFGELIRLLVSRTDRVYLIAHWYSGSEDPPDLEGLGEEVALDELLRTGFSPDKLVTVRRAG